MKAIYTFFLFLILISIPKVWAVCDAPANLADYKSIDGNYSLGWAEQDSDSIGIYVKGDVNLASTAKFIGNIYATGSVTLNYQSQVIGSICAKGSIVTGGEVEVDGNITATGAVTLGGSATTVSGSVESGNSVTMGSSASVEGNIVAGDSVTMGSSAFVGGYIEAGNSVEIGSSAKVNGDIITTGAVTLNSDTTVNGDIDSGGLVTMVSRAKVNGNITTTGAVTLNSDTTVGGDIDSGGLVTMESRAKVNGNTTTTGAITLNSNASVEGDIIAGDSVTMRSSAKVNGDITTTGAITLNSNASVEGDIIAGDSVEIGSSAEVNGNISTTGAVRLLSSNASVGGNITANGPIELNYNAKVSGDVDSDGSVTIGNSANVEGNIVAGSVVTLEYASEVIQNINSNQLILNQSVVGGDVCTADLQNNSSTIYGKINPDNGCLCNITWDLSDYTEFEGDFTVGNNETYPSSGTQNLYVNGNVEIKNGGIYNGNIYSTGSVELKNSAVINGRVYSENDIILKNKSNISVGWCSSGEPVESSSDNYAFTIDTSSDALTCEPHSVNITVNSSDADGNLTPATDYTGSISLSTSTKKGVWSLISGHGTLSDSDDGAATYEFDSDDNGVVELGLLHTDEGEVTVSIDSGDASADATITFLSSLIKMEFSCVNEISGVCINTANVPFSLTLTAVQKDEETNSCESYSPATVDFWSEYVTGDDEAVEIDAVAIGTDTTTMGVTEADATELKLTFSDGVATVAVNYPDAGKIKINVKDESGINGSAETIVNPYKLLISTVTGNKRNNSTTVASTISNPATQASGNGFIRASVPDYSTLDVDTFDVTVQALINCTSSGYAANCGGNTGNDVYVIAPSFANDITLQPSLIFPTSTSSTTATLGNVYSSTGSNELTSAASAGVVSYENLTYDEVGTLGLQATSVDYIVTGNDVTASDVVKIGRFYPDYLAYGLFSVTEACNDDFTYMDQQDISLGYTMQAYAQSTSAVVTENYDYDLGYPVASNDDFTHTASDQNDNSLTTRLLSDGDYDQQNWSSGVYTVTNLLMGVEKGTEEDGPFFSSRPDGTDNHIDYYIQLTGFDGERLQMNSTTSCTDNLCLLGGLGDIAYGRLQAGNGHGSEYQPIRTTVQATYYDGNNFSSFSRDICTTISASQVNKQTISDSENDITALTDLSILNSPLTSGTSYFDFSAPKKQGKFNYYIDLHSVTPWLLDSGNAVSCITGGDKNCISGYVEFGLFRGNDRIINRLQTFN